MYGFTTESTDTAVVSKIPTIINPRYFFRNEKNHFIGVIITLLLHFRFSFRIFSIVLLG